MANVRDFGAMGNGKFDDTEALQHAIDDADGFLEFPRGEYRITKPLIVNLAKCGRLGLHGSGGTARLIMAGPGPALFLQGNHTGTADPNDFKPDVWAQQRMPTIDGLEIEGAHPEADGIRIEGVTQTTLTGVLIRRVRHGVIAHRRARNIIISHCHIYFNKGVGIYLDRVDLHQTIITGSHVSYCRLGGIRIEDSAIRNLQITGNDIEYNNNRSHKVLDADAEPTAEIYIDVRKGSVREGTIASNTIQATYSPGGANIRIIGKSPEENHKAGLWTISGNLIGSQDYNLHLTSARGVSITGNVIYSAFTRNMLLENCRNMAIGSNVFDHNPDYKDKELCTGVRLVDSVDCTLTGMVIQDAQAGKHTIKDAIPLVRDAVVEVVRCQRVNISGCTILEGVPYGLLLDTCSDTLITGCTILDTRPQKLIQAAVRWKGPGQGNQISNSRIGKGLETDLHVEKHVHLSNNILDS